MLLHPYIEAKLAVNRHVQTHDLVKAFKVSRQTALSALKSYNELYPWQAEPGRVGYRAGPGFKVGILGGMAPELFLTWVETYLSQLDGSKPI